MSSGALRTGASVGLAFGLAVACYTATTPWQVAVHETARYTLAGVASGLLAALLCRLLGIRGSAYPAGVGAGLVSVWTFALATSSDRLSGRLQHLVESRLEWVLVAMAGVALLALLGRAVASVLRGSTAGPRAAETFAVALVMACGTELALAPPDRWRPRGRAAWLLWIPLVALSASIGCLYAVKGVSWLRRTFTGGRVAGRLALTLWALLAVGVLYGLTLQPPDARPTTGRVDARGRLVTVGAEVLGALPAMTRNEVALPTGGRRRVDLGWGLEGGAVAGHVRFRATLRTPGGTLSTLLEEPVARKAGGGGSAFFRTLALPAGHQEGTLLLEVSDQDQGAFWVPPVFHGRVSPSQHAGRPNIILVSLDTVRADHLNAYGYQRRSTSPQFDSWAAEGTLFENAMSAAPGTLSSQMSLLTGRYPSSHGVSYANWRTAGSIPQLGPDVATLAEVLQRAGLVTVAFTGAGYFALPVGYSRGFTQFVSTSDESLGSAQSVFQKAFAWLDTHREDPFFLFLHTYEAHEPYLDERFVRQEGLDCRDWRACNVARYDGDVRRADESLGQLRERVAQLGLADRTLVIVTSDHGEEFGDHFAVWNDGHGHSLFDELVHVPLLVVGPTVAAGRRVGDATDLTCVAPTVLTFLGLDAPAGMGRESMLDSLRTARTHPQGSGGIAISEDTWIGPSMRAIRSGPLKLVLDRRGLTDRFLDSEARRDLWRALQALDFPMLFDVLGDPGERNNLASQRADDVGRLRRILDDRLIESSARAQSGHIAVEGDALERLRSLGYVE